MTTGLAQIVRQLQFATIGAFLKSGGRQRVWLRRMFRRDGEVFLLGTAISAPCTLSDHSFLHSFKVRMVRISGPTGEGARIAKIPAVASASALWQHRATQ
jgi:hypothetical protein